MGKRLPKRELLEEIREERDALDALLGQIAAGWMTQPGVTPGAWSVKDILAHVLGWQERLLGWHETERRGGAPAVPAPGMTWRDLKRFNEMLHREHRDRPLDAVRRDFEKAHDRMIRLIRKTPDSDFVSVGRFAWMGPTWTLSDYCRAETASHYRWARKWIRPWWRALSKAAARRS